jgi:hypothetical protein
MSPTSSTGRSESETGKSESETGKSESNSIRGHTSCTPEISP